uniref:CG12772 n=1 Tax=Hydatigena taeniaeformis TaxID=6205 RepID=A0A0R3WLF2_HYDTA
LVAILIPDNHAYLNLPTTVSGAAASATAQSKSRRLGHGMSSNSESTSNLLLACEEEEVEGYGCPSQDAESPSSNSSFVAFTSNAIDRRRRLRDCRHHRQPSASKIPRIPQAVPPVNTTAQTFFQAHTKLANPLRRIISGGFRQRSNSLRPQSATSSSNHHFFGDVQTQETEAADLANFRVSRKISEGVAGSGGGGVTEPDTFFLPQSSNLTFFGGGQSLLF